MMNKKAKSKIFHYNFLEKNRKGFLLAEETLKIVIAVICIGFLVYFLSLLYFSNLNGKKQNQAEATLKLIEEKISQGGEIDLVTPIGWTIFNFTEEKKPNKCAGKNCVCICDKVTWNVGNLNRQITKCQEKGKCLVIENLIGFKPIEIKKLKEGKTKIKIIKTDEEVTIEEIK